MRVFAAAGIGLALGLAGAAIGPVTTAGAVGAGPETSVVLSPASQVVLSPSTPTSYSQTVTWTNGGPDPAFQLEFTIEAPELGDQPLAQSTSGLPSGLTCGPSGDNRAVLCNDPGPLPAGTQIVFQVGWQAPPNLPNTTVLQTTINAVTGDVSAQGVATATVGPPPLSITDSGPAVVAPGSNLTYTFTLGNTAAQPVSGVSFVDPVPPGTSFVSATPTTNPDGFTCSQTATGTVWCAPAGGVLAPNSSDTIVISYNVPTGFAGASIDNSGTLQSNAPVLAVPAGSAAAVSS